VNRTTAEIRSLSRIGEVHQPSKGPYGTPTDAEVQSATIIHGHAAQVLPKMPRALGQPRKTRHDHLQAPRHPVLLPARRQSPCTHTNCSLEYTPTPPRFIRRRADTRTAVGSRRHTQARAAPFDEPRGPPVIDAEREKYAPLIRVPRHHS